MLSYQFAQGKRLSESQAMHSISLLSSILRYAAMMHSKKEDMIKKESFSKKQMLSSKQSK